MWKALQNGTLPEEMGSFSAVSFKAHRRCDVELPKFIQMKHGPFHQKGSMAEPEFLAPA